MQKHVKILLLVCCTLFFRLVSAQDIRGGWVEYEWLSGYTYSYTATILVDSTLDAKRPGINLYDCASSPFLTTSGYASSGNVRIYKFLGQSTLGGPGSCVAYIEEFSRVQFIRNIIQSYTRPLNVYNIVNISPFIGPNSSPVIINPPINFTETANTIIYNPSAFDIDGDSLSYQLIKSSTGFSMASQHILYPNSTVDNSGTVTIPKDSTGLFAFCLKINEWRKNLDGNWQPIGEMPIDFVVDMVSSVGIKEYKKTEQLLIYPNPASTTLTIKSNSKLNSEIEILNCLGEIVLKQNYSESIDVSKLIPGYYFIKVDNSHSKFVKE